MWVPEYFGYQSTVTVGWVSVGGGGAAYKKLTSAGVSIGSSVGTWLNLEWSVEERHVKQKLKVVLVTVVAVAVAEIILVVIEGLRERTEYIPQLWNWENHL